MNRQILPRLVATGVAAAALIAGFVWLYQRSVTIDASQQQRTLAVAEKVKQLDARWNVDVLRSATGLNNDYDRLIVPLTEWPKLKAELKSELSSVGSTQVDADLARIDELFAQKAQGINEFKARNSVLGNSLHFLPTARTEIATIIGAERDQTAKGSRSVSKIESKLERALRALSSPSSDPKASGEARSALLDLRTGIKGVERDTAAMRASFAMTATDSEISELVAGALKYNLAPSEALAAELRTHIATIREGLSALPAPLSGVVASLATHVDVVLRERTAVTALLAKVNAVPITSAVDTLVAAVSTSFARHISEQATYTTLLQGYIVVVLAILLGAAILLVRQWMNIKGELQTSNERVEQVELKLLQANQLATVGELSAGLAHEVNTPLASALNMLWLMREQYDGRLLPYVNACQSLINDANADHVTQELSDQWASTSLLGAEFDQLSRQDFELCLADSITCLGHIKDVVINMGELSRVGQGMVAVTPLEKPIQVALKAIAFLIKGGAVSVETRFGQTPEIECNVAALQQALVNLLKNALQAMPDGGSILIETGVHRSDMVYIAIADTGCGMSPEVRAKIFDRHFGTKANGSGIGLSITKNIIEEHGGEIAVKSTVGAGTKFAISLPVKMIKQANVGAGVGEHSKGDDDV